MYTNLIETLRFCAKNGDCHNCPYEKPCEGTMGDGLYCEAADAIEDLEFACNRYEKDYKALCAYLPKWIPVTERLPEPYTWVLVFAEEHEVAFDAFYDGAQWKDAILNVLGVTHWMPLPEPPKEEENVSDN